MKKNALFESCLARVPDSVRNEVGLTVDIANRIDDLLKEKRMTQRELAVKMGKKESEVSRWLTGRHGFTVSTLAKISAVLGEPIIEVKKSKARYVYVSPRPFSRSGCVQDASYRSLGTTMYSNRLLLGVQSNYGRTEQCVYTD